MAESKTIKTWLADADEYEAQQSRFLVRGSGESIHDESEPTAAFVSDGRWVAECPCGAAGLVHPNHAIARCGECGAVRPLVWPDERAAIEAALLDRPSRERNWRGESLEEMG